MDAQRTPYVGAHVTCVAATSRSRDGHLWQLLNAPKPIDGDVMRVACAVFLVVYGVIAVVRYEESRHAFLWLRLSVCLYAAVGIWLSRRVTWGRARAYTIGLALLMPLHASYINGSLGNHVGEVALTTLATFVALVFVQTGWDLVIVAAGLAIGNVVVLAVSPLPALPISTVAILLGGAIATGTVACLQSLIFRSRWTESLVQLEHALTVSAEWKNRYEAASLASGQILYDWDSRTDEVSYGGAYERMLGYGVEELAGGMARWIDLVHPDDCEAFGNEVRRSVGEKTRSHLQYRIRRKDGSYIVVEDNGRFVLDQEGVIVRFVGFVSDVTERTMAEQMRAQEAATSAVLARVGRELIESLETPVVLKRLCRLTSEVLGSDFSQTWIWKPDERHFTPIASDGLPVEDWEALRLIRIPSEPSTPLFARMIHDDIAQITPATGEFPLTAGMLTYFDVSCVLCVALRRGGEVIGIHAAGYRQRTEPFTENQERIALGIAHLASMALTNAQLVEELERASHLKSEFISTMSHELRTPLNVILGYTDMLRDELRSDRHKTFLAGVRQSSLELLEMIEATLNLNRLATGKDLPQLEAVRLTELWDELAKEFAALPSKAQVAVDWELAGIDTLNTDRRKFKVIVKNLVGNALKFTSAGKVTVRCERQSDRTVLSVRDTGIGIPMQHLPHIFEMFRQVDSSDRRSYGGAGLGLYIVRQLVTQLGGTITVESELGRGSLFTIVFPAKTGTERAGIAA